MQDNQKSVAFFNSSKNNLYATSIITEEESEVNGLTADNSGTKVNWPVGKDDKLINASSEVINNEHVEKYALFKRTNFFKLYNYELRVKVNKEGTYYFTDATNDTYKLSVSLPSLEHVVDFDSDNPTIIKVLFVAY